MTIITEHKRNGTTSTRQCGRRSAEVTEHPRLLFRHGCVGYRGESEVSTVTKMEEAKWYSATSRQKTRANSFSGVEASIREG